MGVYLIFVRVSLCTLCQDLSASDGHPNSLLFQMRLMEEELRDYQRAQDEALTKRQLLEQTLKDLEYELEAKSHLRDDRSRLIKQMEVCRLPRRELGSVVSKCGA